MKQKSISKLVDRYLNGTASEAEAKLVETFLDELKDSSVRQLSPAEEVAKESLLIKRIQSGMNERRGILVSMKKGWKAAVAVAAVLIISISVWFVVLNRRPSDNDKKTVAVKDIKAPSVSRAMITLADGTKVYLDSVGSGQLAVQGNVQLVKLSDGQIAYQSSDGEIVKELKYNTLSNPRGSKVIDMKLSDGSHVWLNSGSSITYPVAFAGNDRKVTIEGEAYFEVAHDPTKPFIVSKGETSVQVLGTHFNVNAYSDEDDIKVTLLEGSVKVNNGSGNKLLKPGEQALVDKRIQVLKDVDVDAVIAWQRGMFEFNNADLQMILRQVSRWYDVEIVYEKQTRIGALGGGIARNLPLSEVLKLLEANGAKFRLEGKKLIVL
jgi:ferric-dicitrate binding protein FerR (iron transport regulator)